MPRIPEQNREYMRAYRAKRAADARDPTTVKFVQGALSEALARVFVLEQENKRLKDILATAYRVTPADVRAFNTRPFTPVPKKGQ